MGLGVSGALPGAALLLPMAALIGLIFGSFLSALTWRLPRDGSVTEGRSRCTACDHPLGPRDLVPLLSWLLARGRCRHCGAAVSLRYPLIEAACVGLCTAVAWRAGALGWDLPTTALTLALAIILLGSAVVDLEHGLLPDALTLAAAPPALALGWLSGAASAGALESLGLTLAGGLAGGGGAWLLRVGFRRLTGRHGLGLGDVKLMAVAGLLLGPADWPVFLLVAGLGGVVFGLVWRGLKRGPTFPFGPMLILALLVMVLFPGLGPAALGLPGT